MTFKKTTLGIPKPDVVWFKDVNTMSDIRFKVKEDGKKSTLVITTATVEDSGEYRFVAKNEGGMEEASMGINSCCYKYISRVQS